MNLDKDYWNKRYLEKNTPWDAGEPTTPIKEYADSLEDRSLKILIPGAGNGHEARYLFEKGFTNIWVCDWAPEALFSFSEAMPSFPKSQLINDDYFKISQRFDLIIEQTFFCALPPTLRENYVMKTATLLQDKGRLVGLLFANHFPFEGPPFGGSKEEYLQLFSPKFELNTLEICYNSIPPRKDQELFINFLKRS
jgi:thiopurine S-methyltransferase